MNQLIQQLRESEQDFEFYPTTAEIIDALVRDVGVVTPNQYGNYYHERDAPTSALDIGAGTGKVLHALKDRCAIKTLYAIEKAVPLLQILDDEIFVVGTDFHEQSLVSKAVDLTFCNPPYSEFEAWAVKIIRESSSRRVYLVIPTRWKDSELIKEALKYREAKFRTVGEFSFVHAEDRAARAVVNLIRIELSTEKDDAFDRFFDEQFAGLKAKFAGTKTIEYGKDEGKVEHEKKPAFAGLVVGPDYPSRMVALYDAEMDHIRKNYDLVALLDADLLREFDVTPVRILGCLKARLAGLRNTYWSQLVGNMKQVTDRLTSRKRRIILERLQGAAHVDFTVGNIHAVIIWVLKNANQYVDTQLVETFEEMVEKANVRNYVSNRKPFTDDRWRYSEEKPSHIALEYRLVLHRCGGIEHSYSGKPSLSESGCNFLGDLLTVARNLGFECDTDDARVVRWGGAETWTSGAVQLFHGPAREYKVGEKIPWTDRTKATITGKVRLPDGKWQYQVAGDWMHEKCMPQEVLFEVRAYRNRNIHLRLGQKFALALNVEYGRLKGWLKNGAQAATELNDKDAPLFFGKNLQLGTHSLPMLGAPAAIERDDGELDLWRVA
jgi:hypothetical protein